MLYPNLPKTTQKCITMSHWSMDSVKKRYRKLKSSVAVMMPVLLMPMHATQAW